MHMHGARVAQEKENIVFCTLKNFELSILFSQPQTKPTFVTYSSLPGVCARDGSLRTPCGQQGEDILKALL